MSSLFDGVLFISVTPELAAVGVFLSPDIAEYYPTLPALIFEPETAEGF